MRFGSTEVIVLPSPEAVAEHAADETCRRAARAITERGRFVLALSGGSTPRLYHQALAAQLAPKRTASGRPGPEIDWTKVFILFSDERAVPADHKDSNYRMAEETLLSRVPVPPGQVHRIEADDGDHVLAALAYERQLVEAGLMPADLVILGMGEDGHTASLFPASAPRNGVAQSGGSPWITATEAPPASPVAHRVTFTYGALAAARSVLAMITGHSKAARLKEVLSGAADLPMRRVLESRREETLVIVDQAAASRIAEREST